MEFRVQQRAEIWYETTIEAESFEEAITKAYEDFDLDWASLPETVSFRDDFWLQDETGKTYEQKEN